MDKAHFQQLFDTTMAIFQQDKLPNISFSLLIEIDQLDTLLEYPTEFIEFLQLARKVGRLHKQKLLRCGDLRPVPQNTVLRGEVPVVKGKQPQALHTKRLERQKPEAYDFKELAQEAPVQWEVLKRARRFKGLFTASQVAEKMKMPINKACTFLSFLVERGAITRRKPKKGEATPHTRFVYEVAA